VRQAFSRAEGIGEGEPLGVDGIEAVEAGIEAIGEGRGGGGHAGL